MIDSIAFTYVDQAGKSQSAGPWGGSGGAAETVSAFYLQTFQCYNLFYNEF